MVQKGGTTSVKAFKKWYHAKTSVYIYIETRKVVYIFLEILNKLTILNFVYWNNLYLPYFTLQISF